MSPNGKPFQPTEEELDVHSYWEYMTDTATRSAIVRESHLRRIRARFRDGYTAEELKRVVNVAMWEPFYVEHGYHKQPEIIWRNAARVDRLLSLAEREMTRPIPL